MSIDQTEIERLQRAAVASVRAHWLLFLIEGIILLVLGLLAIIVPPIATLAVTIFIGWLFLISGIVGLITTFWMRREPGFWWALLSRRHHHVRARAQAGALGTMGLDAGERHHRPVPGRHHLRRASGHCCVGHRTPGRNQHGVRRRGAHCDGMARAHGPSDIGCAIALSRRGEGRRPVELRPVRFAQSKVGGNRHPVVLVPRQFAEMRGHSRSRLVVGRWLWNTSSPS